MTLGSAQPAPDSPKTPVIIVGVQRAGTTSLASALTSTRMFDAPLSLIPEPRVFLSSALRFDDIRSYARALNAHQVEGSAFVLEKSVAYFEAEGTAEMIREAFPNARVIVVLRNPLFRTLSHYRYTRSTGLETLDLRSAIHADLQGIVRSPSAPTSMNPFTYFSRSLYSNYLTAWMSVFGRNCHVVFLENLVSDAPSEFSASGIQEFMEPFGPFSVTFPRTNAVVSDATSRETVDQIAFLLSAVGPAFARDLLCLRRLLPDRFWDWDTSAKRLPRAAQSHPLSPEGFCGDA